MGESRPEPIIEYSRMVGKRTADLTANDISKFMKWWMGQPIREDLYDMAKKKTAKAKSAMDIRKAAVGKTKMVQKSKKEDVVIKKAPLKRIAASTVVQGAKSGRVEGKKGTIVEVEKTRIVKLQDKIVPKGGFEKFQEKKQAQRHVEALPVPVDVEMIDESVVDDLTDQYVESERKRAWKDAQAEQETVEDSVNEEEELSEEEIEEIIEENSTEEEEQVDETDEQERVLELAGEEPTEEPIALNMGLTALDAEALEHVLVEAINTFEIPENYIDSIESIIDGLKQQQ